MPRFQTNRQQTGDHSSFIAASGIIGRQCQDPRDHGDHVLLPSKHHVRGPHPEEGAGANDPMLPRWKLVAWGGALLDGPVLTPWWSKMVQTCPNIMGVDVMVKGARFSSQHAW